MIRARLRTSVLPFVLALSWGCREDHGHEHPHEAGEGEHGHEHEGASEVVTRWGATTQLFVEFPALVVGEASPFAAHLTRLADHSAIDSGTVVVELHGGSNPVERFTVDRAAVAGIFRPIVEPAHAGPRKLTLRLDSSVASEVHELGEFTVYSTRTQADAAAGEHDEPAGSISFLLEQQWKVSFRLAQVETRELRPNIPAFARLSSPPEAESIVAAPRDGRVNAVGGRFPHVGDEVEEGHVIFGLGTAPEDQGDPASLDHAVREAVIGVAAAQREVDRLTPLVEQGVVAQRRLDEANSALSVAESHLSSARRRKRSLGQSQLVGGRGDSLDVPSPIPGTVAEVLVAPGAWVTEGQQLARVVDRDRLWLDVSVPEAYVARLGKVSGAWFELEGMDKALDVPGSALVSIGTEIDAHTRTLPVRFQIDNTRRELFAGMTTQAHLVVDAAQPTTAIPVEALVEDRGADVVYVQIGGESFERRMVQLGIRDGDYIEILDGVAPGEWVVARGAHSVKLASSSTASVGHGHAH
jgi:cobalt-zinc-cadmium efflux system membrane fusion protein